MNHDDPFNAPPKKERGPEAAKVPHALQGGIREPSGPTAKTSPSKNDDPFAGASDDAAPTRLQPQQSVLDACLAASSTTATELPLSVVSEEDLSKLASRLHRNLLYAAAVSLFGIINQLKHSSVLIDVPELRRRMIAAINSFEQRALAAGYDMTIVQTARYCLCTTVDEAVLSTEWAIDTAWSQQTLLYTFYSDTSGGEMFFTKLDKVQSSVTDSADHGDTSAEVDLLEVLYVCLALGFCGKYRILDQGDAKLEQLRQAVYGLVMQRRAAVAHELSPSWRGAEIVDQPRGMLLVGLTTLMVLVVLLSIFVMLSHYLNERSDQSFAQVQSIGRTVAFELDRETPTVDKAKEWWNGFGTFLEDEIRRGVLELIDTPESVVIRIFNNGLFPSASAAVSDGYQRVFQQIGRAIETKVPGAVTVIGHSDNRPIRTVRFPSNWHLSTARAEAVAQAISPSLSDPDRLSFEGRSDTQPLASNVTPEGQAANRRVEILLPKVIPMADAMPTPEDPDQADER
ncbi:MAG: type VI secretion system protein TssL, long form [Geminicoccaceae bacterium]